MTREMEMFGAKVHMEDCNDGFLIRIYARQCEKERINTQVLTYLYKEGFIDENGFYQAMNNLRNL